jgi:hypothetical protein
MEKFKMKTIHKIAFRGFEAIVVFLFTYGLIHFRQILFGFAEMKKIMIPIVVGFLVGPIWIGYSRLNFFDKTDDLNSLKSQYIDDFTRKVRERLFFRFLFVFILTIMMLVGLILADPKSSNKIIMVSSILISFSLVYLVKSLIIILSFLRQIERNRQFLNELQKKERNRSKLIEKLKKSKQDEPLNPDSLTFKFHSS